MCEICQHTCYNRKIFFNLDSVCFVIDPHNGEFNGEKFRGSEKYVIGERYL